MRIPAFAFALMATLLILPGSNAQTPVSTPASGVLLQATLDRVAPDGNAVIGITRITLEPGGSVRVMPGTGPTLSWVESGEISVTVESGSSPTIIPGSPGATPGAGTDGGDRAIEAGDGFVLAPGTSATLRNDGSIPAIVLDLISAPDTVRDLGDGASEAVVMSTQAALPPAPLAVTFSLVLLEPGGHLTLAAAPSISVYAAQDPEQIFQVTGSGFNRFNEPVAVHVLTIAPA